MNRFRLADGRHLAWREAGAGRPLLLLHGWAMSSAVFSEAIDRLAGEFRVLAPDLRGHGASEPGPGYSFADLAADLTEWLAGLQLHRIGAVGWSLGGQVLLELLGTAAGARIERLALVGSTPRFTAGEQWSAGLPEAQVRAMARDLHRRYQQSMGEFFDLQFAGEALPAERRRQIIGFAVRQGQLPAPEVALAALETLRTGDQRRQVATIGCPLLVMHGALDRIVPPAAGRWLAAEAPADRFLLLPEAGHAPFLSRPEEVFELWRKFFLSP